MNRTKSFDNKQPLLYLVATPIGNLKEISQRALEVFNDADIIAAEDTRNTRNLLGKFNISKTLYSLHEHNENEASEYIISQLKQGKKVAYVSDAGYPGISDPGYLLVKHAIAQGISVSTVCGSSAFLNALVSSGLPTNHFYFYGFLPIKEGEAKSELEKIKSLKDTLIFYESPHRINKTLILLENVLGNRVSVIGRELTKINEEFLRGTLQELIQVKPDTLIGEMVIIVSGNNEAETIDDNKIIERINHLKEMGISTKTSIEIVSEEFNINKNYIKKLVH